MNIKEAAKKAWPYLKALKFPLALIFLEVVFHLSTTRAQIGPAWFLLLLFAGGFGCLLTFLLNLIRKDGLRRWVSAVLMFLLILPFGIEFFVHRQFGVMYDLATVVGGAGNVVGGFMSEVFAMVFSPQGLLFIGLILLPFVLSLFKAARLPMKKALIFLAVFALASFGALGVTSASQKYKPMISDEYFFQSSVEHFGLLPSLGMEVGRAVFGAPEAGFEISGDTEGEGEGEPIEEGKKEPEIIDYGYNVLDIDFAALAQTTSGTTAELCNYVASLQPTAKNKYTGMFEGKNLILITAEAFTAEVIDPERTPTLYRLATKGIQFTDYYQPSTAGTTGGEYANIFGMLPTNGGGSFKQMATHLNYYTMGYQLNERGYWGRTFHNNEQGVYKRTITHNSLGYSEPFLAYYGGMEEFITKVWPESDWEMMVGTVPMLLQNQPFNAYYMTVSGHSNYSKAENAMARKNWEVVENLDASPLIKGYLGANQELENAMAFLVKSLEMAGIADDTVIVLSTDHYPYGLFDANNTNQAMLTELYGFAPQNTMERDHNRLILWCGCLEDEEPIVIDTPTSSIDILPTLFNLFGIDYDSRLLAGRDVFSDAMPLMLTLGYTWRTDKGYYEKKTFTPFNPDEELPEDYVKNVNAIVRNKIKYMDGVADTDFYRFVFDR